MMDGAPPLPPSLTEAEILGVHHWTDRLFSFTCAREPSLRFESGQFLMLGLRVGGKPLLRAYSIASAAWQEQLEFFSIKVADGPLTSRLQSIRPGERIILGRKPTGTLLAGNLLPGRRLYLLSTGTGLAPFLSLVTDPAVLEGFETVVVTHGCRHQADFAYRNWLSRGILEDEFLGEFARDRLRYVPHATRDDTPIRGRITDLIHDGGLAAHLGLPELSPAEDRVMICGSEAMLADLKAMLEMRGFTEGSNAAPGHYVVEKAFAER